MRVPVNMYKKYFKILLIVFPIVLLVELLFTALGNPIVTVFPEADFASDALWLWVMQPIIGALFIDGIVNFFLTVNIIKESRRLDHWPAFAVVVMTIFFALEMILGTIFLIPNIIIFGLKGRIKNRAYEVKF